MARHLSTSGYILIRPINYKYKITRKDGLIFEHRYIMENHIGRQLTSGECVHHKNEIKTDNRIENLMLLGSNAKHRDIHRITYYGKCKCGCGEPVVWISSERRLFAMGHRKNKIYVNPKTGRVISRQRWWQIKHRFPQMAAMPLLRGISPSEL